MKTVAELNVNTDLYHLFKVEVGDTTGEYKEVDTILLPPPGVEVEWHYN